MRKRDEETAEAGNEITKSPEESATKPRRPKRKPIGTRDVLDATQRPGYTRRFVNIVGDRVQRFLDAGYSIVKRDAEIVENPGTATPVGSIDERDVGNGRAVLMEIPKEWHDEDQAEKQRRIDAKEQSMHQHAKDIGLTGSIKITR